MSLGHKVQLTIYLLFWIILSISLLFGEVTGFGNTPFNIGVLILISLGLLAIKNFNCLIIGIILLHISSAILLGTITLASLFFFRGNEWEYVGLILGAMFSFIITYNIFRILKTRLRSKRLID